MKTLIHDEYMTVQRAANGTLHATLYAKTEPDALRAMLNAEDRGWTVDRCTKLGDGTYLVQAGGAR